MLTDKELVAQIKATAGSGKDHKIRDGGGMYLFVTKNGATSWRLKYRVGGKEKLLVLGRYPEVSLKAARSLREDAKRALAAGKDPSLEAKRAKLVGAAKVHDTFEKHARAWHESNTRWKPVHAADVITSLERDIFPDLGSYPIQDIDEPLLLAVLRKVEARGAIETAHRLRQRCERIFKYAKAHGTPCGNAAFAVREAMKTVPKKKLWPAIVDVDRLRQLTRDVDLTGCQPTTKLGSRFLSLVAQRPGMVRRMHWAHVEGIDWAKPDEPSPKAMWKIPSEEMKLEFDMRGDDDWDHWVPLSQAAADVLHAARRMTGNGSLVFPSTWDPFKPMSENTITYLYGRIGYKGQHVAHGWRSSFSTIMNGRVERLALGQDRYSLDRLIIDLMLAHKPVGMSAEEFTYNRHAYMERRRELAEEWAELILPLALPPVDLLGGPRRRPYR